MEYKLLGRTGLQVSVMGFGASPLGNEFGQIDPAEGERAVHTAIDQGINFFDVAPYYGRTLAEERLGTALRGQRHKVVLATKCGRYDKAQFDFSAARVKASVDESLGRLRTDYVDLLTAHDIEFADREQIVQETIPALRMLQSQGKARFVAVSGLPLKMLADVTCRGGVDAVLSYCHWNLLARDLDSWLTPVAASSGIGLINASPLHMRILTDAGAPSWHPAPQAVKAAGRAVVALCRSFSIDPALVSLAFCLKHPYVASTLAGMSTMSEVEANVRALNFIPPAELSAAIEQICAPVRDLTWPSGRPENSDV